MEAEEPIHVVIKDSTSGEQVSLMSLRADCR
jgi:hypothetical protein